MCSWHSTPSILQETVKSPSLGLPFSNPGRPHTHIFNQSHLPWLISTTFCWRKENSGSTLAYGMVIFVYSFGVLLIGKASNQASLVEEGIDLPRWVPLWFAKNWLLDYLMQSSCAFRLCLIRVPPCKRCCAWLRMVTAAVRPSMMGCANRLMIPRKDRMVTWWFKLIRQTTQEPDIFLKLRKIERGKI